jgi:secreted PhoX family phosphatase
MVMNRRQVLSLGAGAACALWRFDARATPRTAAINATSARSRLASVGPLREPDANGLRLPEGFSSRIVARSRVRPIAGKGFEWHDAPDGGAVFAAPDGGWIYVSNSESSNHDGGASALRFSASGHLIDAYPILAGTNWNCAGGPTPWGTWLSCEEHRSGLVWECDPFGDKPAHMRSALGAFTHEAVAVDPLNLQLYLTEDVPDGCWYRFTPARIGTDRIPDLRSGQLEVAEILSTDSATVRWHPIRDAAGRGQATRYQVRQATRFSGGEGCWHSNGVVYFSTKGDDRIWAYTIAAAQLRVIYSAGDYEQPVLRGVDNVTVSASEDVLVAEDNGDMQIVAITPEREVIAIVQVAGQPDSEVTGPAFDPSGTRLYFSSQWGATGRGRDGITYEVTGPFNGPG